MKKLFLFAIVLASFHFSLAQKDNHIVIGTIDSVHSNILKETRKFWVYVPNQNNPIYSTNRYPVMYLLDGDAHFHSVTGMMHQLTAVNGNAIFPEMIVVGIPNTDRTRDLTPTHSMVGPGGQSAAFFTSSGGGENFTSFIEKELIPFVESHYPTATHRMLVGHSFGGLFAINTLVHHPDLFNTYVSIDPSLWWDHQKLIGEATSVLQQNKLKGKSLFIGIANTMPAEMDTTHMLGDTTGNTFHIRSIFQFVKKVSNARGSGLRFGWKYYPTDDHGSVPLITEYDALHFIFDYYKPRFNPNNVTAENLNSHYKGTSEKIGYTILPPESLVNNSGYARLQQKQFDQAYAFFKLNVDNYPKSFNVFDSMGDYYVARNEKAKAIEYFTKALSLRDYPETKQKLEQLKRQEN